MAVSYPLKEKALISDDEFRNKSSPNVLSLAKLPVPSSSVNSNNKLTGHNPSEALTVNDTFVSDQMWQLSGLEWPNNLFSCLDNSFPFSSSMLLSSAGSKNIWLKAAIDAKNRTLASCMPDKPFRYQRNQTATEIDCKAKVQSTGENLPMKNSSKFTEVASSSKVTRSLFESFIVDQSGMGNSSRMMQQPDLRKSPHSHFSLSSSNSQTSSGVFASVSSNSAVCTSTAVSSFTLDLRPMAVRPHMTCRLVPLTTMTSKAAADADAAVLHASTDNDSKTLTSASAPNTTTNDVNCLHPGKNICSRINEVAELPGSTSTSAVSSRSAVDPIKCQTEQRIAPLHKGGIARLDVLESMSCGATGQCKAPAIKTPKCCAPSTWQVVTTKSEHEDCYHSPVTNIHKGDLSMHRVPPLKLSVIRNCERGDEKSFTTQYSVESFSNAQKRESLRAAGNRNAYSSASESSLMDTQRLKAKRCQATHGCTIPRGMVNEKRFSISLLLT